MQLFWLNFIQSAFVYLQYIYALNDGVRLSPALSSPPPKTPVRFQPPLKSEQMSVKRFKDVHVKCFILW